MFRSVAHELRLARWIVPTLVILLAAGLGCESSRAVVKGIKPLDGSAAKCVAGKTFPLIVDVEDPDGVLTYKWFATAGSIRVSSDQAQAGTYQCPGTGGTTETVTVDVYRAGKHVDQKSLGIEIIAAPTATAQPPAAAVGPTVTAKPGLPPTATGPTVSTTPEPKLTAVGPTITARPEPTSTSPAGPHPEWCVPFARASIGGTKLQGTARITAPADCAELVYANDFSGTYSDVPSDVDLWVLVFAKNNLYYPQSDNAAVGLRTLKDGSRWRARVYLGAPESGAEKFDVVLVLANREASAFIGDKLKAWASAGNYPGLAPAELPKGLTETQRITVRRTR